MSLIATNLFIFISLFPGSFVFFYRLWGSSLSITKPLTGNPISSSKSISLYDIAERGNRPFILDIFLFGLFWGSSDGVHSHWVASCNPLLKILRTESFYCFRRQKEELVLGLKQARKLQATLLASLVRNYDELTHWRGLSIELLA